MVEYGYMEGGALMSRFLEEHKENWTDENGVEHVRTVTVEEQAAKLSHEWKPVDEINDKLLFSEDPSEIIVPVPYDAGDRICYRYVRKFDEQKVRQEIQDLKDALAASDYKVAKCYEASLTGQPMPYDVQQLTQVRQSQRDKVNELEAILQSNANM